MNGQKNKLMAPQGKEKGPAAMSRLAGCPDPTYPPSLTAWVVLYVPRKVGLVGGRKLVQCVVHSGTC